MKLKKFVLTFVVLTFFLSISNAQTIQKVKVLFFSFNTTQEFPLVYSDSVIVSKTSNDTVWFNTTTKNPVGQGFYYKAGRKVYKKEASKTILLYDYDLVKGDSFFIDAIPSPLKDTFIVDSVYQKKMYHRTFKAWHLSNKRPHGHQANWEWIEGIGEQSLGWNTKLYIFTDGGWEVKGMCLNDSVIYWDTSYNYFKDRNPSPSCSFDSISKRLSVKNAFKSNTNIYPNPASDVLTISSASGGIMNIIDYTGKICMENISFEESSHTFDISELKSGVYLVAIQIQNNIICRRICVVRP